MITKTLENRRKKDSYEIIRNGEIIFYYRKDVFPRWLLRLLWTLSVAVVTATVSHLIKIWIH